MDAINIIIHYAVITLYGATIGYAFCWGQHKIKDIKKSKRKKYEYGGAIDYNSLSDRFKQSVDSIENKLKRN